MNQCWGYWGVKTNVDQDVITPVHTDHALYKILANAIHFKCVHNGNNNVARQAFKENTLFQEQFPFEAVLMPKERH